MRTSLFWIDGPWPGRLAIMPRPRGGDWLEDEMGAWQLAGANVVVSLLQQDEIAELDLATESDSCRANNLEWLTFPIVDRGVPNSASATLEFVLHLEKLLSEGKNIAIHCRQGVGRSALLAACLLTLKGMNADAAFERIGQVRGARVPDTAEQRAWVGRFAKLQMPASRIPA